MTAIARKNDEREKMTENGLKAGFLVFNLFFNF